MPALKKRETALASRRASDLYGPVFLTALLGLYIASPNLALLWAAFALWAHVIATHGSTPDP